MKIMNNILFDIIYRRNEDGIIEVEEIKAYEGFSELPLKEQEKAINFALDELELDGGRIGCLSDGKISFN